MVTRRTELSALTNSAEMCEFIEKLDSDLKDKSVCAALFKLSGTQSAKDVFKEVDAIKAFEAQAKFLEEFYTVALENGICSADDREKFEGNHKAFSVMISEFTLLAGAVTVSQSLFKPGQSDEQLKIIAPRVENGLKMRQWLSFLPPNVSLALKQAAK